MFVLLIASDTAKHKTDEKASLFIVLPQDLKKVSKNAKAQHNGFSNCVLNERGQHARILKASLL